MIFCENCNFKIDNEATTDYMKNKVARENSWTVKQDGKCWRRFCCNDCKQEYLQAEKEHGG